MADRRMQRPRPNAREPARRGRQRPELFDQTVQPVPRQAKPQHDRTQPVILPLGSVGQQRPAGRQTAPPRGRQAAPPPTRRADPYGPAGPEHDRYPAPAAREEGHRRRVTRGEMRRRRRRRRIIAFTLLLALAALGVALSVTVLLKVEGFRLEGPEKDTPPDTGIYTEDAILAALNVPLGENIFQFSLADKEQAMAAALPYLETIQVRRSLPGTIVVRVTPAVERYVMLGPGGWVILSGGLKVLQVSPNEPAGLMRITGAEPSGAVAGRPLALLEDSLPQDAGAASGAGSRAAGEEEAAWLETVSRLLKGLEESHLLDGVTSLDLGGLTEISFLYQGRIRVLLGTANSLDYKLKFAEELILNVHGDGLLETDRGSLDISHLRSDGSIQPVFSPGTIE